MNTRRLLPTLLGLALVFGLAFIRLADPIPVAAIRDMWFDAEQRLHPRPGGDTPVRVVDIDETSLAKLGQWPWPRATLGTLTMRLRELGAMSIAYDFLFPEPDRLGGDNDAQFATALGHTHSALGFSISPDAPKLSIPPKAGIAISGSDPKAMVGPLPGAVAPIPILAEQAEGLGGVSLDSSEVAGTIRRVPVVWSDGNSLYPSLAIEALRIALRVPTLVALADTRGDGTLEALRIGDFTVPTTPDGNVVLYDRVADPSLTLHASDVLGDDYMKLANEVQGRIILVGTSASGLLDLHSTALNPNIAGVLIHAGVIDQIVKGQYLSRADWVQGLEILVFIIAGALLVFVVLRIGPIAGLAVVSTMVVAMVAVAWFAFTERGWQIDATFPVFGALLVYGTMVYSQFALTEKDRRQLRRAFGYYVAPELLSRIEKSADQLKLGGEARQITVMFSDMRGFTSFTEKHTPEETFSMLNTMFGALGEEIVTRSGTIDKFIGDAIMAFWNAPLDVADHARLGCEAALGMRRRMAELNSDEALSGIRIGIGLSTGDALVGNMGLESRFDYSAIGDTVNVASRVEGESKAVGFDIVAAEATRRAVPDFAWLPAGSVQLKGKAERLPIHILVGDAEVAKSMPFLQLREAHEALLAGRGDIASCAALAAKVDPLLARFYELVPERTEDFVSAA